MSRNFLSWQMTQLCNYECVYCNADSPQYTKSGGGFESNITLKVVTNLVKMLKDTGKRWKIGLTGGELFIYPKFVDMCEIMIKNDIKLAIETNLTPKKVVKDFINRIDPNGISDLRISIHIDEREKRNQVDEFIEDVLKLKERKFDLELYYILTPGLIDKAEKDIEFFKKSGIDIVIRPFKGYSNNKYYPESYTKKGWRLVKTYGMKSPTMMPFRSKGLMCNAGHTLIRITPTGHIQRCMPDTTEIGNLFRPEQGINLLDEYTKCKIDICRCFGHRLVKEDIMSARTYSYVEDNTGVTPKKMVYCPKHKCMENIYDNCN